MQSNPMIKGLIEFIKTIAIVLIMAFLIKQFLIQTFIIEGVSMEPNFHQNEYLIVDKLTYKFKQPQRGDVVILIPPDDISRDYIKRVIGLPGDTVEIKNGSVFVNNEKIKEPYLASGVLTLIDGDPEKTLTVKLGADQFYVLGDNRPNSKDSRSIGIIPKSNILGRTMLVLLPKKDFQVLHHIKYVTDALPSHELSLRSSRS